MSYSCDRLFFLGFNDIIMMSMLLPDGGAAPCGGDCGDGEGTAGPAWPEEEAGAGGAPPPSLAGEVKD